MDARGPHAAGTAAHLADVVPISATCAAICRRKGAQSSMHQAKREGDSYQPIEMTTGTLRRQCWSESEKGLNVAVSEEP